MELFPKTTRLHFALMMFPPSAHFPFSPLLYSWNHRHDFNNKMFEKLFRDGGITTKIPVLFPSHIHSTLLLLVGSSGNEWCPNCWMLSYAWAADLRPVLFPIVWTWTALQTVLNPSDNRTAFSCRRCSSFQALYMTITGCLLLNWVVMLLFLKDAIINKKIAVNVYKNKWFFWAAVAGGRRTPYVK